MIYTVRHLTRVIYDTPVRLAHFNLRLRPVAWPGQTLLDYRLSVSPNPSQISESEGPYVVNVARLTIAEPLEELTVDSEFRIDVTPPLLDLDSAPDIVAVRREALVGADLTRTGPAAYLFGSRVAPMHKEISDWAAPYLDGAAGVVEAARALNSALHAEFAYDTTATESDTLALDAFRARSGVCQDFAHIMISALRAHGLPAAYVSGYLRTEPPPGEERLIGADATHAWVNVWCGRELGWIGFDPTNDCLAAADHIVTAMGRDYADVAPIDGVFVGSSQQTLEVAVDVIPVAA